MGVYQSTHTGQEIDTCLDTYLSNSTLSTALASASAKAAIINAVYPVGSIYMSINNINPNTIFGGTWVQIEDTFLLAAGQTHTAGSSGGSSTHTHTTQEHTLTVAEMPAHRHNFESSYKNTYNIADGPVIFGATANSGSQAVLSAYNAYSGRGYTMTMLDTGEGGGHSHGDTGATSTLPPYIAVYVWKRTA